MSRTYVPPPLPPRETWEALVQAELDAAAEHELAKQAWRDARQELLDLEAEVRSIKNRKCSPDELARLRQAADKVTAARATSVAARAKLVAVGPTGYIRQALRRTDLAQAWSEYELPPELPRKGPRAYVSNRELSRELKLSHAQDAPTDKLWEYFTLIAKRVVRHRHFSGYSYRDQMVSDGVIALAEGWRAADPRRENFNPFAYFTQTCFNAYYAFLNAEKQQRDIKMELTAHELSLSGDENGVLNTSRRLPDDEEPSQQAPDKYKLAPATPKPPKVTKPHRSELTPEERKLRYLAASKKRWETRRARFGPSGRPPKPNLPESV